MDPYNNNQKEDHSFCPLLLLTSIPLKPKIIKKLGVINDNEQRIYPQEKLIGYQSNLFKSLFGIVVENSRRQKISS